MSRGIYKTCNRKISAPPPSPSIQFNKVFSENSNKPCAAKSTGTLGKWGITSFTSIRSSSFTVGGRKADTVSYKKNRYSSNKADSYSFNSVTAAADAAPKPKKFFKSRNAESDKYVPRTPPAPPPAKRYNRSRTPAKEVLTAVEDEEDEEEEEIDFSAPPEPREPSPPKELESNGASSTHNPPIVLRIFKGTAQLLSGAEETYVPKKERESRRRSHSTDSNDPVAPKKHKHRMKDLESLRNDLEDTEEECRPMEQKLLDELTVPAEETETVDHTGVASNEQLPDQVKEEEEEEIVEEQRLKVPVDPVDSQLDAEMLKLNEQLAAQIKEEEEAERAREEQRLRDEAMMAASEELLEDTYTDAKMDQVLDLSSNMKQEYEMEEPSDVPLDLHIPHHDTDLKDGPHVGLPSDMDALKTDKEESNSDSDYGDGPDRPSVLHNMKTKDMMSKQQPPKKGSIFKSRVKRNAHYIHKWSDKDEGQKQKPGLTDAQGKVIEGEFIEALTRITNYAKPDEFSEEAETFTSVTCSKQAKEFYTVVRNVKRAHQIQESGEFQEFNDDVEYILDALKDNNPIGTRCLSAITLASKCMVPAFRMHVRAHGTVAKFFKALHDASKDQSLGMCTATVMLVLSQDRLNMDLDRESLELMLSLLESDASSQALEQLGDRGFTEVQLAKTKEKVLSLCREVKEHGHALHLNLDNITVGQLAMETLLSLTSKRAGEWFKEELRDLGGLEHIVRTIVETADSLPSPLTTFTPQNLDQLRKIDRCLRVLENVTLNNEDNSNYLVGYGGGRLVDTVMGVMRGCALQLPAHPAPSSKDKASVGAVLKDTLVATLKVLINVTHDFNNMASGSALAGQKPGLIDACLYVLLIVPDYIPDDQKFDLTFMSLMLLINLVENCVENRNLLMKAYAPPNPNLLFENEKSAITCLAELFVQQEELARNVERKTDAILDGEEKPPEQAKSHEELIEETVALLLQKAGRHMEYTFVAAYIAMILGYMTMGNEEFEYCIRCHMPSQNYSTMLSVLHKFYNFMTLTAASTSDITRGIKATEMLIKHLTEADLSINKPH